MNPPAPATPRVDLIGLLALLMLGAMSLLPLLDILAREGFGHSLAGTIPMVQHMTLWITFLGAILAARSDRLLALATTEFLSRRWKERADWLTTGLTLAVCTALIWASLDLARVDREYGATIAWGIPLWLADLIMPIGFLAIGWHVFRHLESAHRRWALTGILGPLLFAILPESLAEQAVTPTMLLLGLAVLLGLPIFAGLGGIALLLFWAEGTPVSAVPGEAYRMATSPMLPAIPLFTLGGYLLSEGGSSQRLLRLFTALVGWMPGGLAVVSTLLLAFFTPLTGASGITILAMGGLLLPMLIKARYPEPHALGLVTVSGAIGALLPPSLPVILYAYYADLDLDKLFVAGALPGILLILSVALWGAWRGQSLGARRTPFDARELLHAIWGAKWEILLPVVILVGLFGGYTTLVEAAALTVLYAFVVVCVIFRELDLRRDLPRVAIESATLVGGFMIILGVALGLTNYLILEQIPMRILEWVQTVIHSRVLFLLALNLFLIVVGALMDIYSAIIVIVPLLVPMARAYGIDPIHLAIIFLANSQLGYLMPPMGENLFLAAYRFRKDLPSLYVACLPYILILLAVVLLITYVPFITLGPLQWWQK